MTTAARQTVYYRAEPEPDTEPLVIMAGEPGKTGLHGDWLAVARAIDHGADTIDSIAREMEATPFEVAVIVHQMAYLIVHNGALLALDARGVKRLRQAEANGR